MSKHWFGVVLGALVVVGGSFVAARAMSSPAPQQISLTQAQAPAQPEASAAPKARTRGRRLVHGDLVVAAKDGQLRNVRVDHGVLRSVDGSTLVLKEADGSTVDIATTEQTRFRRDRRPAKITDLKAGDDVWTMRVKSGETYVTMRVRAVSSPAS